MTALSKILKKEVISMVKRKLGASVIILCIAVVTLVSGTYAWFLVGGFANLFDIGFDVIQATGAVELQGDEGTANGKAGWGDTLIRDDFKAYSFIADANSADGAGHYQPVSSADGVNFIKVGMENHNFVSEGTPKNKATADTPQDIMYNDFTFRIRSVGEEIVASDGKGAYMTINLNNNKVDDPREAKTDTVGAARAARVAVTFDGKTTIYDVDGEANWKAVTEFQKGLKVADIADGDGKYNQIIDDAETDGKVTLTKPADLSNVEYKKLIDSEENAVKIYLGNVPANSDANGKEITVRIWLEGNDQQCVDYGENTIAGKSLMSYIDFGVDE